MNRWSFSLCLSTSFVALAIGVFALKERRSRIPEPRPLESDDDEEMRRLLESLDRRVALLERKEPKPERQVGNSDIAAPHPAATAQVPDLLDEVLALSRRLESLEDGETIAQLAKAGEKQLVEKEFRDALERVRDRTAPPEDRFEGLKSLRRFGKTHRPLVANVVKDIGFREQDIVLPMLELALDRTLDPAFRSEVLRHIAGSKVEEIRPPLLDLFAFDETPEVREGALDALMWHLDDSLVRDAIIRASREDRHEAVRERAERYLPKVEHFVRLEERTEGEAAGDDAEGKR